MTVSTHNSGPVIMGILNVTPDSFSDGGRFITVDDAVAHAKDMVSEGADIVDIGGESTRPGSERVSAEEQIARTGDIIQACRENLPDNTLISIDTTRTSVAEHAVRNGANIVNDISAVADLDVPYVMMHMQGTPQTMQEDPWYDDVIFEVKQFLLERADLAIRAGVRDYRIILDPGIGFGKTRDHNLQLLGDLQELVATGFPVLLGTSRKRFMGAVCEEEDPKKLVASTCATTALGVMSGVKYFRVHDVRANYQAAAVAWAIKNS